MEFGLCCLFYDEPIKFKTYTYSGIKKLSDKKEAHKKVTDIWEHNINTLQKAIDYCRSHNIKGYRIGSDLLPQMDRMVDDGVVTHEDLDRATEKLSNINSSGIILSMHPGQHVNMGSPTESVIHNSMRDLKNHFFVAKPLGCTEINFHLGGSYGDKESAMVRFKHNMHTLLTPEQLSWITLENDELNYSIKEVIEVCKELGVRATYDIHHQRCYQLNHEADGSPKDYFDWAGETWKEHSYQRMHISTPRGDGYTTASKSRPHHDFISVVDMPAWMTQQAFLYVDIEAKAKEVAIKQLRSDLDNIRNSL
jgi:UV DNA damage endonuclease